MQAEVYRRQNSSCCCVQHSTLPPIPLIDLKMSIDTNKNNFVLRALQLNTSHSRSFCVHIFRRYLATVQNVRSVCMICCLNGIAFISLFSIHQCWAKGSSSQRYQNKTKSVSFRNVGSNPCSEFRMRKKQSLEQSRVKNTKS